MADIKVYKNEDYTASRVKHEDSTVDYFIKYHSSTNPQEVKVTEKVFLLYVGEFRKPLTRNENEKRRKLSDKSLDDLEQTKGKNPCEKDFSKRSDTRLSVEMVLKTCTVIQQRRFTLYHDYGYTFNEIAIIENCKIPVVFRSVRAVEEKIKNNFL